MDTSISDARSIEKAAVADVLLGGVDGPILDAGCGRGVVAEYLVGRGRDVIGYDASEVAISKARLRGIRAEVLDLEKEIPPGRYDGMVCLDLLQHSPYPLKMLKRLLAAVNYGGVMIIGLPNEFHFLRRISILVGRLRFTRFDGPHPRLFWMDETLRLISAAGLVVEKTVPLPLLPPRHAALRPMGRWLARLLPSLMAIGYVVKARKPVTE